MREHNELRREIEVIGTTLIYDQLHAQTSFDLEMSAERAVLSLVRLLASFYRDRQLMYAVNSVLESACMTWTS